MSESNPTVTVYRFSRRENGRDIAPQNMWGTIEAIGTLDSCAPIMDSAREVPREALEGGFVFRTLEAVQPAEAENVYR